MTADVLRARLAQEVALYVSRGARVETHDDFHAVLVRGRLLERRLVLRVVDSGGVTCERLPLDRERLVILAGIVLAALVLIAYALLSGDGATVPSDGGSPI